MAAEVREQPTQSAREPEADLLAGRKWLSEFEKQGVMALPPLSPNLEEFYINITTSDGWQSKCKIVRPRSTASSSFSTLSDDGEDDNNGKIRRPLIVYFYGGGFGMGSPEQVTRPAREWAEQHNATIVCPSYRLTPEHAWPQSVKDGWDVVSYLSRHAETDRRFGGVNLDHGFIVCGVSAGGGVAGVVSGIAVLTESDPEYNVKLAPQVDEKLAKPLTGLFLSVPLLAHQDMIPPGYEYLFTAWEENRHDPTMSLDSLMKTFSLLRCTDYKSPWFSPINVLARALIKPQTIVPSRATVGPGSTSSTMLSDTTTTSPTTTTTTSSSTDTSDSTSNSNNPPRLNISNHPPVYIQSCAKDPLRDDATVYHRLLQDVGLGSRTKIDLFPDDGHTAWTALPLECKSTNPTMKDAVLEGMTWLLHKNKERVSN